MNSLPIVLVTEGSDEKPLSWLRERAQVIEKFVDDPGFDEALASADAMVVRTYTKVNEAMLAKAPRLKVVGRGGVGLESIDVAACRRRGVQVVYTPAANTLAVGDFVFGYIIQLLRPFCFFNSSLSPAEFKRIRAGVRGKQLNELTIGIVGMGRVGKRIGHIAANGFGMRVVYNDILAIEPASLDFPAVRMSKEELYQQADILSLHVTMIPGNENLIGAKQLAMMKPDAILINTSRGEVLDANALAQALKEKRLAGAAIDVFWPEPPPADFPLLGMSNVLLTPHLGARTATATENMSWVVRDVTNVLEGKPPAYPAP
ncbi:MAG TPA: NAD(P)-dependent oxidoreductase [Tepidisphaeraceae bacterium]|jgi:phosphoglycerate dehydrogenase-like enzyme